MREYILREIAHHDGGPQHLDRVPVRETQDTTKGAPMGGHCRGRHPQPVGNLGEGQSGGQTEQHRALAGGQRHCNLLVAFACRKYDKSNPNRSHSDSRSRIVGDVIPLSQLRTVWSLFPMAPPNSFVVSPRMCLDVRIRAGSKRADVFVIAMIGY